MSPSLILLAICLPIAMTALAPAMAQEDPAATSGPRILAPAATALSPTTDDPTDALRTNEELMSLATELMETSGAADQYRETITAFSDILVSDAALADTGLTEPEKARIRELIVEEFEGLSPQLLQAIAELYTMELTAEEMEGMIAFYQSDTGRAFLQKLPILTEKAIAIGRTFGETEFQLATLRAVDRARAEGIVLE